MGAAYDAANQDVFVVTPYDASTGYTQGGFQCITRSNIVSSSITDTGVEPNAACCSTNLRVTIPNLGSYLPATPTNVNSVFHLIQVHLNSIGIVEAFGRGGS